MILYFHLSLGKYTTKYFFYQFFHLIEFIEISPPLLLLDGGETGVTYWPDGFLNA